MTSTCTAWNPTATTLADNMTIGTQPSTVFVTVNNSVFVTSTDLNRIVVWSSASILPTRILSGTLNQPKGLFVASTGTIYVDNGLINGRVEDMDSQCHKF